MPEKFSYIPLITSIITLLENAVNPCFFHPSSFKKREQPEETFQLILLVVLYAFS
ncbi:hypothetical protein [Enterococcus sp. S22(2020)]|uniref:hypothetical protein n=1 Tax=Enterococcus sp. S22(2020) TaxID=2759151 RepID=UPI001CE0FD1E|nr:hypothetical protein [Enterococcus sp. S22(2020)]